MNEDAPPGEQPSPARPLVLPYQRAVLRAPVTVRKFFDAMEAQIYANELASHDIEYALLNQNAPNALGWYSGFGQVELQVLEEDAAAANELLSRLHLDPGEVEPAEESDPQAPLPDPDGGGMLVAAAAYEDPQRLYDAAALLGAAHVECFLPVLVPRGDRPKGVGERFVIRVRQADRERAREVVEQAEPADHDDEPRCPKCGSWQTYLLPSPWPGIWNYLLRRAPQQPREVECLRCHHRWTVEGPDK